MTLADACCINLATLHCTAVGFSAALQRSQQQCVLAATPVSLAEHVHRDGML
jgi:hypothetical protein